MAPRQPFPNHDGDDADQLPMLRESETDLLIEISDLAREIRDLEAQLSIAVGQFVLVRNAIKRLEAAGPTS